LGRDSISPIIPGVPRFLTFPSSAIGKMPIPVMKISSALTCGGNDGIRAEMVFGGG
jgi:hypothetical protein